MKCVFHILATGERHAAVAVLGGQSVCAACVRGVADAIAAERSVRGLIWDAQNGHLP